MVEMEVFNKDKDITIFDELMQEIAQLPKEQQEKIAYFAQGVLATAGCRREAVAAND